MKESTEKWLPIKDYENFYRISSWGRVLSFRRDKTGRGKFLKPLKTHHDYRRAALAKGGTKYFQISRLVAQHFIPNPDGKPQVNHINGIKTDNRVENLEWCTQSENQIHARATGLNKSFGANHYKAKLTEAQVKRIRLMKEISPSLTNKYLANMFHVCKASINFILNRKTWTRI